jgi:hypothetical protein
MIVSEITLYNVLKSKLGEQEAQTVVEGIKQEVRNEFDSKKDILATKEGVLNLKIDMERGFRDNLKWTVATIIACTGILLTAMKFVH